VTFYERIVPIQEPFDLGLDDAGRSVVVFNAMATKAPSVTLEEEAVAVLVAAGVGTFGVTLFGSSHASLPQGAGPFLVIVATGGVGPVFEHNDRAPARQRPTLKLSAHASSYVAARAMARAAYDALVQVRNQNVVP
jgi:hypothetical protein